MSVINFYNRLKTCCNVSAIVLRVNYVVAKELRLKGLINYAPLATGDMVKNFCSDPYLRKATDSLNNECLKESHSEYGAKEPFTHETKLIKVAVVGTPNSGKSTLINGLVKRRVCSMSSKVHTTRSRAKAIMTEGHVQVVLSDSPGLVNVKDSKKHNLEKSFLLDAELSVQESDLVAVVHDVSNSWTRDYLDVKILRLLHLYQEKPSILILNKVDALKSKRKLLDLTSSLTCGSLKNYDIEKSYQQNHLSSERNSTVNKYSFSEKAVCEAVINENGWSNFEQVFMVSALTGSGIDVLKEFILQKGLPSPWMYQPSVFTDQKMEEMILLAVREKILEKMPKEIPYNIRTVIEHISINPEGGVIAVVLANCNHMRHQKMLIGSSGRKIKEIAQAAEEALENAFLENVKLKIVVQVKK